MTLPPITSPQNPAIKHAVRLRQPKARRESGQTRIEGARELLRALDAGLRPDPLYVCDERIRTGEAREAIERVAAGAGRLQPVNEAVARKLGFGDRDEGLTAVVAWVPRSLDSLRLGATPLVLVLDGIEKPGNLGAVLRTADAGGVDAVVLCDPAIDPTNPNAIRASLGTIFTVPLATATREQVRPWLAQHRLATYAAIAQQSEAYSGVAYAPRAALVMGSEQAGLDPDWRAQATACVHIPMRGAADSLNVSTATAILLFEMLRQRG